MSYTFGGATSDKITATRVLTLTNGCWLFSGWIKPTTLTAGRGFFGTGTTGTSFIAIGTTTSELKITLRATVDAVFDTSGLGLVVNVWQHVSVLVSQIGAVRVWKGLVDSAPVEVTVTNTTVGSGTPQNSTSLVLGNIGTTAIAAFQGMMEQCVTVSQITPGPGAPLPIASNGTIAQDEADVILANVVRPFWKGEPLPDLERHAAASIAEFILWDMACNPAVLDVCVLSTNSLGPVNPTITGATFNDERAGAKILMSWPNSPILARR